MVHVYTFGHSSRSIEDFVAGLRSHGVTLVIDIRQFPGSRRNPQFDAETLAAALDEHAIGYHHLGVLEGRRSDIRADSPNGAWENDSFQAYADYALTDEFQTALDELATLAKNDVPAIVCAETVYWRCHRRIVADWLLARDYEVSNIYDPDRADEHELTRFAKVRNGRVTYPADGDET